MNFVLIAAVVFLSGGTDQRSLLRETDAGCQELLPRVYADIEEYNTSSAPDKIVRFAAVCLPLAKAPQGKDI